MSIRISVSLRITSADFPQILTAISTRPGKSWYDIFFQFRMSKSQGLSANAVVWH